MNLLQTQPAEAQESSPVPVEDIKSDLESALQNTDNPSDAIAQVFSDSILQHASKNTTQVWIEAIYENYQELNNSESNLQAWRNIGGIAFEKAVVSYYNARLPKYIKLKHVSGNPEVQSKLSQFARRRTDKDITGANFGDAVLMGEHNDEWYLYGVVQTMTSFKGRLKNESWKGELVQDLGLFAPLVTLDAASNTDDNLDGEVGSADSRNVPGRVIEEDGSFTNMYSFNMNTEPSTTPSESGKKIWNIGSSSFDPFINDSIEAWDEFITPMKRTEALQIEA